MSNSKYQRCTRCIMDNKSDDKIRFDKNGYCNYCTTALAIKDKKWFPNAIGCNRGTEASKNGSGSQGRWKGQEV